jgi:hypothetical protein
MLLWHLAGTLWLFRWVFRDPRVDVRFLAVGAVLPDLIDLPASLIAGLDGRAWAHSLLFASLLMVVVLIVLRRGARRKQWMALAVGVFFHLLLDGMWVEGETLFYPFLGFGFAEGGDSWGAGGANLASWWTWAGELVGAGYLWWVWVQSGLGDRERRGAFLDSGRLIPLEPEVDLP